MLARGKLPCDVLFVGEAPGRGEDTLGQPFVGPAGSLQDRITAEALAVAGRPGLRVAYGNLLGCLPVDQELAKVHAPPPECVDACRPRLESLVRVADPRLIVALGNDPRDYLSADDYYTFHRPIPVVHCKHPAAILRDKINQAGEIRRQVATLVTAIDRYLPEE